jgi:chromosome segregation ATPase
MNNVVGKMLIVMQLVFSILFMCFAGAVYTFQGQWRTHAMAMEQKVQVADGQVDDAIEERNRAVEAFTAEVDELKTLRDNLKAEQRANADKVDQATKLLAASQLERDKAVSDSEVATTEAAARVGEATVLNREVQSLRNRISEMLDEAQAVEGKVLSLSNKLAEAEDKEEQQLTENSRLKDMLRFHGVDPRVQMIADVSAEKDKVDGFVTKTQKAKAQNQEYVQITIGSDDRVYKDMKLILSRGAKYLCEARVISVFPDYAVCVVVEETRQGLILEGDNVTTKL